MWEPLEFEVDPNYEYINDNKMFKICSNVLYYLIAAPIIYLISKIMYGLKVEGKENLKSVEGAAISISNHIHIIDCAMIGLEIFPKRIYYTALDSSFKMPIIRYIVKLLNALPISNNISSKRKLMLAVDELLEKNQIVHFYPEASLWPYYRKIRKFKNGAFEIATRNHVPVIPMVFTYREPTGIRRYIKKKPFITLNILEPIYPDNNLPRKERIEDLKYRAYEKMNAKNEFSS